MFRYEGTVCPYCKKELHETDTIAVCPDCSTPHHRECYLEHKECANTAKHAEGFEWVPDKMSVSHEEASAVCPRCGRETNAEGKFCNYCGYEYNASVGEQDESLGDKLFRIENDGAEPIKSTDTIDDVVVKDWATYIGPSANYYLFYFKMQLETGRKYAFTISAMLFPPVYFLYRKVWWLAAVSFVVQILLNAPAFAADYLVSLGFSSILVDNISLVCSGALFLFRALCGFFAIYIYRQSAKRQIQRIKTSSSSDEDFHEKLAKKAGPSLIAVQIFFLLLSVIAVIFYKELAAFFNLTL